MSDLRHEIARTAYNAGLWGDDDGAWTDTHHPSDEWEEQSWVIADAVLRVVGDALMSDEAVREACAAEASDWLTGQSRRDRVTSALSAAWRVVTGSNHE